MREGQGYGNRQQVEGWFKGAPPEDAINGTIAGLRRLAELPQEHRDRFTAEVGNDPSVKRLFADLGATV